MWEVVSKAPWLQTHPQPRLHLERTCGKTSASIDEDKRVCRDKLYVANAECLRGDWLRKVFHLVGARWVQIYAWTQRAEDEPDCETSNAITFEKAIHPVNYHLAKRQNHSEFPNCQTPIQINLVPTRKAHQTKRNVSRDQKPKRLPPNPQTPASRNHGGNFPTNLRPAGFPNSPVWPWIPCLKATHSQKRNGSNLASAETAGKPEVNE